MKKPIFLLPIFVLLQMCLYAQVGIGTATPAASAKLDISSTTQGLLPPRMTQAQRNAILIPAEGLIIYCTNCGTGEPEYYNGSAWVNMNGNIAASLFIPTIGSLYQGGMIFYIDSTGRHGLMAAFTNSAFGRWYNGTNTLTGAIDTAIGTGLLNSDIIMAAQGIGGYAAYSCRNNYHGSHNDWFLPSKAELNIMFYSIGPGAPSPFTNIGLFEPNYYWSSSEFDDSNAWCQDFNNGAQSIDTKYLFRYARAIRSF